MRILIINELRASGGTEIQTKREIENFQSHNHQVFFLSFDPHYSLCINGNDNEFNIPVDFNIIEKTIHRLFLSPQYTRLIKKVLNQVKPDYVHINHVKSLPLDTYFATKSIPSVQTLRDYSFVCPKETCILKNNERCNGYVCSSCKDCIKENLVLAIKLITLKNVNRYRKKYVNFFVAPSDALAKACTANNLPTECLNNPFDFSILIKNDVTFSSPNYLYYGEISEKKGVSILVEAFDHFHAEFPDKKLVFAGGMTEDYKNTFENLISNKEYFSYLGKISNKEIMELYQDIFCVIVPSLWIENYPNTVLEAIANKTLVIGTNRGGIPELIDDFRFTFDVLDMKTVEDVLRRTQKISEKGYREIVEKAYNRIIENNSLEKYYERLMNVYERIGDKTDQ